VKRGLDPQWLIEYETTGVQPKDVHTSEWKWVKARKDEVILNDTNINDLKGQVLTTLGTIPF